MPSELPMLRTRKPILVYLYIALLLCHCQRPQLWVRSQTEILSSPERTHRHLCAMGSAPTNHAHAAPPQSLKESGKQA